MFVQKLRNTDASSLYNLPYISGGKTNLEVFETHFCPPLLLGMDKIL